MARLACVRRARVGCPNEGGRAIATLLAGNEDVRLAAGEQSDGAGADQHLGVVLAVRAGGPPAGARRPAGRPARGLRPVPGAVAAAGGLLPPRRAGRARQRRRGPRPPRRPGASSRRARSSAGARRPREAAAATPPRSARGPRGLSRDRHSREFSRYDPLGSF